MSLLLQALQKASKNRNEGEEPGPDPLDSEELSLEPIGRPEPVVQRDREEAPLAVASSTPAHAAALIQARSAPGFDPVDYAREHYMIVFVGCAFLVAAAYGTYVYIQVANPAWLRSRPVAATRPLPPPPAAGTPSAAAPSSPPESPASKLSGLPAAAPASPAALPAPAQAQAPATVPAPPAVPPAQVAAAPAAPSVQEAEPRPASPRVKLQRTDPVESRVLDEDGIETVVLRPSPRAAARAQAKEVRPAPETAPSVAPEIGRAYEALQAGANGQARTLYAEILRNDPKNIDALLGSAAIAWKEGQADEAAHFFQRVLELEPRNAYAQAGLISMLGSADPAASESRLRQLIAREPSAFLYFTLGNLYADQGQWPAAQQAYFQAYQSQPDNPDYAFNLAVGLEHLGQTRHALDYYRKALDLSFRKGRANFDQGLVIQRVGQLSSRVEQ